MGVSRDIEIKVPIHKEEFSELLKRFVDRKNARCQRKYQHHDNIMILKHENDKGYDILFGNSSYDSFLFFLLRAVKTHYETGVSIVFDADGDDEDERMVINYVDGKFDVDMLECDAYKLIRYS